MADTQHCTIVYAILMVVVGFQRTDNDIGLAGNSHEPRIRMGGSHADEQYRRNQPFRCTGIPYLYSNSLQLCGY